MRTTGKPTTLSLILFLAVLLITTSYIQTALASGSTWQTNSIFTLDDTGRQTCIVLDSLGSPHISYYDAANGNLKYAYKDSRGWYTEVVDDTGDVGWHSTITLDYFDNPHISYYDITNGSLKYAYKDSNGWRTEVVDDTGQIDWYTSIAIGPFGNPGINYYDVNSKDLKNAQKSELAISDINPANGATGIPVNKIIAITLNENIQAGDAYMNITLKDAGGNAVISINSIIDNTLIIDPVYDLNHSMRYIITIPTGALKSMTSGMLIQPYTFSFTTQAAAAVTAPTNLKASSTDSNITLSWEKVMGASKYNIYRDEGANAYKKLSSVTTSAYTDNTANTGITYTYYVTAVSPDGRESDKSKDVVSTLIIVKSAVILRDVPSDAWYKSYVERLIKKNVIGGYVDGTFRPSRSVTRAEFAKMLCVAMGWRLEKTAKPTFSDVPADHWVYQYVQAAISHGAIGGYEDGTFRPNREITRAEIAKIAAQTLDITNRTGTGKLKDISSSWARDYISTCSKAGILNGYEDGSFRPDSTATRAEAATVIVKMLNKK